jgi:hypothetical protein
MKQIRSLLEHGDRSEGWDFSQNLDCAKEDGDERILFLTALADVIAGREPVETLERFEEWRAASG